MQTAHGETWSQTSLLCYLLVSFLYKPVNNKITIISLELNPSAKIKFFKIMYNSMFSPLVP